jgi:hypothetical protein
LHLYNDDVQIIDNLQLDNHKCMDEPSHTNIPPEHKSKQMLQSVGSCCFFHRREWPSRH